MRFDVDGALKEGYTPTEIAEYLGKQKKFDVDGARKEGYSDTEIINYLNPKVKSGILTDIQRGVEQAVSTGKTTLGAIIGSPEEAAKAGIKREEDISRRLGESDRFEQVKKAYEEKGLLPAALQTVKEVPGAIAEQAPNIAEMVAGAKLGAKLGSPFGAAGRIVGGLGGAFLPSAFHQYGSNIQRQAEKQIEDGLPVDINQYKALSAAAGQGALDVAGNFIPLGKTFIGKLLGPSVERLLTKEGGEAAEKLAQETFLPSLKNMQLGSAIKGTTIGAAAEIPTEIGQQMLERWQAGLPLTSQDALDEYGKIGFETALLGPLGILGRVSDKSDARRRVMEAKEAAAQQNQIQKIDIPVVDQKEPQTFFVSPTGEISSDLDQLANAMKFKDMLEQRLQPTSREVYASEADRTAVDTARWEEARQNSPALQKFNEMQRLADEKRAAQQAKIDEMKAAQSAFTTAEPVAGMIRPPSAEEIAAEEDKAKSFQDYTTAAILTPDGLKIVEGNLGGDKTKVFKYTDEQGVERKVPIYQSNIVINPTEQAIYDMETVDMGRQGKIYKEAVNEALTDLQQKNAEFLDFIKTHPVDSSYIADIAPELLKRRKDGKGYKAVEKSKSKGFFKENGYGLDDLTKIAHDSGFLSDQEFFNPQDQFGTNAFINKLSDLFNGHTPETPRNALEYAKYKEADNAYSRFGYEMDRRKDFTAQTPTMEQMAQQEPAVEQTPEEAARLARESGEFYEVPEVSDKFKAEGVKIAADLRKALDKMGLKQVGLRLEENMVRRINGELKGVNGTYFDKMISLSLSGKNIFRTMNHEALHALKDLGFFSNSEWKILENAAKSSWMEKYNIAKKYGSKSQEVQLEEAIAHAFSDYATEPPKVRGLMAKVVDLLKRIGNVLRGRGFKTAEDIFGKAKEGKLKGKNIAVGTEEKLEIPSEKTLKAPMSGVDQAYADKIRQQFTQKKATVKEKFEEYKPKMYDRIIKGLFDEFRFIKQYSPEAYMKAHLSKGVDGALEGLLYNGQVKITDGALDLVSGSKGLIEVLKPLGSEVDQYQIWKALNRDAQMPADKRSFDKALVDGRDKLLTGDLNGVPRSQVYNKVLKEEQALNRSVLDVAKELGLIDEDSYNRFYNDIYYIPFYKAMEENGDVVAMGTASKLSGQYFSKALKGGEKKTNDLMENVLLNWSHILSAAMKNKAAVDTLQAAESMGAATKVKSTYEGKDVVKVMEDGKLTYYAVNDPDLLDSISLISYMGPKSAFLDVAKGFKNVLRYGVTLNPAYKVRNLIRDTVQSAAVSDVGLNVLDNVHRGLQLSDRGNPTFMSALMGGGIFEMGTAHEGDQAALIKRLVEKGVAEGQILDTPDKIKNFLKDGLEKYNELGNRFENANRLALYEKLRKEGKSHLEASYAARDLMNFSAQGSWKAIKVVSQVVPFFNARLQGLYKLGKDGVTPTYRVVCNTLTGKPIEASDKQKAQRFTVVSSAVMLASMLLYMQNKDDDDFKRREDWDRDNFWWFKVGDVAYRIPKPFEIGALGTIAERTLEQMYDDSVESKVFTQRLNSILLDTFSMNPMPQMFKPLVDLYANKDSFTGQPIESAGMERLSKQERYTESTSALAKALGGLTESVGKIFNQDFEGLSPIEIDYAIKSYFGWTGSMAAAVSDKAAAQFSDIEKPGKPLIDTLAMGFIKTTPETQSKYMKDFYENGGRINQAFADMKRYAELGDAEKLNKVFEERGNQLAMHKTYDLISKQLADYRRYISVITNSKDLSKEDKELEIQRVRILMSEAARMAEDIRKSLKKS